MDGSDYSEPKKRRPPTPHHPTQQQRDMVRVLISNGVPHDIIAEMLNISPPTFKKHYRVECRTGFERVKALIGTAVVRSAMNGNVGAQKYWLGTHGGPEWRIPKELQGDLTDPSWTQSVGGPFDLIVSGIAIHNLDDLKLIANCYRAIHGLLVPGGVFLNCDHFGRSDGIEANLDALKSAGFEKVSCPWKERLTGISTATRKAA